jgi:hypothetical protein
MTEPDFETSDPSISGVRIADFITRRIFAAASLYAATECADGRALTGAEDVYAFWLILSKLIIGKHVVKSEHPAPGRPSTRSYAGSSHVGGRRAPTTVVHPPRPSTASTVSDSRCRRASTGVTSLSTLQPLQDPSQHSRTQTRGSRRQSQPKEHGTAGRARSPTPSSRTSRQSTAEMCTTERS